VDDAKPRSERHRAAQVDPTPGGSRATLSVQYGGLLAGLVARLTAPVHDRYLQLEADGLKARSESLRS
jgi:hypothetical protein